MKKKSFFVAIAMLSFTALANAQTTKGSIMLGGTAGFDVQLVESSNVFNLDIQPQLGFFIADNLAVGGNIGIGFGKAGEISSTSFAVSPFGRYYLGSDKTRFFLHAQVGIIGNSTDFNGDKISSNGYIVGLGPGVAFFLNDHVAIEGVLGYNKLGGDFDYSDIGFRFGVQAFLGGE